MGYGIATSAACLLKAGDGVSTDFKGADADTNWNILIGQAEAVVNCVARHNYSDTYASLTSDAALLLEEIVSNLAGIYAIQYDMAGYTSRTEAEDMVNILRDGALRGLALLRDVKTRTFINRA